MLGVVEVFFNGCRGDTGGSGNESLRLAFSVIDLNFWLKIQKKKSIKKELYFSKKETQVQNYSYEQRNENNEYGKVGKDIIKYLLLF